MRVARRITVAESEASEGYTSRFQGSTDNVEEGKVQSSLW